VRQPRLAPNGWRCRQHWTQDLHAILGWDRPTRFHWEQPIDRNSRLWFLLLPVGVLLGAALAIWLRTSTPPRVDLDFGKLTDMRGGPGSEVGLADRYLLVSFGFTSCPDICPLTLLSVHGALKELGGAAPGLVPIFITLDPGRDTPERLAAYVQFFDPRIRGYTGSEAAISQTAAEFNIQYRIQPIPGSGGDYTVDHTALMFLLDPERRLVASIPQNLTGERLSAQIVKEFREAADP
jgi:protein SCO1/2